MKTIAAILFLAAIAFFIYSFVTSPEGYEDEDGFHFGSKE